MRVNNIYSLLLAVESGVGLAALPDYMVQEKSTLVKVLPNVDGPKYSSLLAYLVRVIKTRGKGSFFRQIHG